LRSWLARNYPAGWTERRAAGDESALAGADLVLTAIFVGAGEAAAKAAIDAIRDKIGQLARRYPAGQPAPATVETVTTAQAAVGVDEAPRPAAAEPVGLHRDEN
ncbi:MAG: hypothetical protein ACRDYZ_14295, partial [Acidimicrobiales bacterium]